MGMRVPWVAVVVLSVTGVWAPPATAGVASISAGTDLPDKGAPVAVANVTYRAGPAEANDVAVRFIDGAWLIGDPAGVAPGTGCGAVSPAEVRCPAPAPAPGADRLEATETSYAGRTDAIHVDLDGEANDGAPAEHDRVAPIARHIVGGAGPDTLTGGPGEETLDGGPGADELSGLGGIDLLDGEDGPDRLDGGDARDRVSGGPGADVLYGEGGDDYLTGGPDDDRIDPGAGRDAIEGGPGTNTIDARDSEPDLVGCADDGSRGSARIDAHDLARHCAALDRDGIGRPRILVLGRSDVQPEPLVSTGIGCSQDQRTGCRGTLRLISRGRTIARRTIRIPGGSAKLYRPRVPDRLFRRASRSCGTLPLTVRLTTRDTTGRVTIQRRHIRVGSLAIACNLPSLLLIGPEAGW